jgi:hypothetical protein
VRVGLDGLDDGAPRWRAVAAAVPGVAAARAEDGVLSIEAAPGADVVPDLVAALVAAGARIRSVAEEAGLEQVYLRLVEEAGEGGGAGAVTP